MVPLLVEQKAAETVFCLVGSLVEWMESTMAEWTAEEWVS